LTKTLIFVKIQTLISPIKTMTTKSKISELNLQKIINDLFIILSDKEKVVITKRFALDNKPKQTLEKIGKNFLVTRERVRQIESSALKKLKRNISNTQLNLVNKIAHEILNENGGVLLEKKLISKILTEIFQTSPIDASIVKLSLTVDDKLVKVDSPKEFHAFWHKSDFKKSDIKKVTDVAYKVLKRHKDIMKEKDVAAKVVSGVDANVSEKTIASAMEVDLRLKKMNGTWGLMEWRHVNPKSIRDKINIILRQEAKPLHFVEISNRITNSDFDKKTITVQAVHNDLIRYGEFVLVGRGLYALDEWGFETGTVADVIAKILEKEGPLSKKEIIKRVLNQRDVKVGTISLNLQKSKAFVRVGRAVYAFDKAKWEPDPDGRGRKNT
jgi:hypothetical protein